jgi:GT2 family glycosyltransferase
MPIQISAIICTYNRADLVVRAIESLASQTLDRDDYEILLVDNASSDDTRRLVEEKLLTIPNLRYVYEPRLGLAIARNTGLASSKGRILAFLDDDAIAAPDHLEEVLRVFESVQPSPGLLCGPVVPIWGAPRPAWLKDDFLGLYSVLNWSETPRLLEKGEWVAGANFAVARDAFSACGGFDERLGRKGTSLLCGEDTDLSDRIRLAGYIIYYTPGAVVQHYIHPERISRMWLYRRVFWGAASKGIVERQSVSTPGESIRYASSRVRYIGRLLYSFPWSALDTDRRLRWTQDMAWDLGRLYGFLFLAR